MSATAAKQTETSLPRIVFALLRHYLGGRGLILLTVAAGAAGLALNWSWLVAVGIAPLLLALAPCAAMCALGLCAHKMADKPDAPRAAPESAQKTEAAPQIAPADVSNPTKM